MIRLSSILCLLLLHTAPFVFAALGDPVPLDASNVTGWRPGTCSLRYLNCDPVAGCDDGLLTGNDTRYYRCFCPAGVPGDGFSNGTGCLFNRTQCFSDNDCHQFGTCNMTDGYCQCDDGFIGDGAEKCDDINECLLNFCDVHAVCQNTPGSFVCTCDYETGYQGDGFTCTHACDGDNDCHPDATCNKRERRCACKPGFTGSGTNCTDIDECADPNTCPPGATCFNEPASFRCECSNGYINKGGDCIALPLDCEDIFQKEGRLPDKYYIIDPDFTGPADKFVVYCDFHRAHAETELPVLNDGPWGRDVMGELFPDYGTDPVNIIPLLNRSSFCYQSTDLLCSSTFQYNADFQWRDAYNQTHTKWAGSSIEGMCGCGELEKCDRCYCGHQERDAADSGLLVNKDELPITYLRLGDTPGGRLYLGALKCAHRTFDIPADCEVWRKRRKPDGPYHIDIGGIFLVYCDMTTYPHVAVTEVQVDRTNISLTTQGTVVVDYIQTLNQVLSLVSFFKFCIQRVEYVCQNSGITGGRVYVNVSDDSHQLTYFPGANGVTDSCGCGATQSCQDPDVRCDCDILDGIQRRDLGDIIDKGQLPVRSVTGGIAGSENYFLVSHLQCAMIQFGIPPNCEKWRTATEVQPWPYTYFIDPDGPIVSGNTVGNQPPFLAQCIFNDNPPYGITVIHHTNETAFGLLAYFRLAYLQVTMLQILALKDRSTFCTQTVDIDCQQFSLTFAGGVGLWEGINDESFVISDTLTSCTAGGGCQCDGSNATNADSGLLTEMGLLPIQAINFTEVIGQLTTVTGASANITIGPLQCSELFPTCADLYKFVQSKSHLGEQLLESETIVTIDADGPGNISAFEVECMWPDDTIIEPENPGGSLTVDDPTGKSQCFDITYTDEDGDIITPEQLVALRNRSDNCFQTLKVTCLHAKVSGKVNYTTCDGITQSGWAGTLGQDGCQCGVTRHCTGGTDYKCNCDLEDGEPRVDGAVIIHKPFLPVCQVCFSLDGIPANMSHVIPKRRLQYYVSGLNCHSGEGRHIQSSCQIVRLKDNNVTTEKTEIVYMHRRSPIPVACHLIPDPPMGMLEVFPEHKVYRNVTGNQTFIFRYYTVNITVLLDLMLANGYCAQKVYFFCLPSDQQEVVLNGTAGWYDIDGNLQQHWDLLMPEEIENARSSICNEYPDLCDQCGTPVGHVVYKKTLLPITALSLNLTSVVSIVVDSVKCSDLLENCYQIMEDGTQIQGRLKIYAIDPDGAGGVLPMKVTCLFRGKEECAVTMVHVDRRFVRGSPLKGKKKAQTEEVTYYNVSAQQIQALANISHFCWQPMSYRCKQSRLINKNMPVRSHYSLSDQPSLSFGTGSALDFVGCPCGMLNTCGRNRTCYCDAGDLELRRDEGLVTAKEVLPVTQMNFGAQVNYGAEGVLNVGNVRCSNNLCDQFPRDCQDGLNRNKYFGDVGDFAQSGEFFIQPNPEVCHDPFLVYCDVDPAKKIAVTRIITKTPGDTMLRPGESTDVEYYIELLQQIGCLIHESQYCVQAVAYECYLAQWLGGGAFWQGLTEENQTIWGGGVDGKCTCGAEESCGGVDSRTQQLNRSCNCDVMDAKWRMDAGLLTNKTRLPVLYVDLSNLTFYAQSRVNITIGDLLCSQNPIEFDECATGFYDCGEHAYCNDTVDGYTCTCKTGWRGKNNNRTTNPDLPVANGRECIDDQECMFNVCPIGISDCVNTPGSFECYCHPGYEKTGPTTCEDIDECKRRIHDCDQNARCVNQLGTYKCQCHQSYRGNGTNGNCYPVGNCVLFGDPHARSFDSRWVDYQGVPGCPIVAVTDACPEPGGTRRAGTFTVLFTPWRQEPMRHGTGEFTWVKEMLIHLNGHVIEMLQDRVLIVDGIKSSGYSGDGLILFDNGRQLVLKSNESIEVYWDGKEEAEIYMPTSYNGQLCGICGNYNGNDTDDWILGPSCNATNSTTMPGANTSVPITDNEGVFGNSWMVPSNSCVPSCARVPPDTACIMDPASARTLCDQVYDRRLSRFAACLRKLNSQDLRNLDRACVYDVCHVDGDVMVPICNHARKIAELCQQNTEVNVSNWRTDDFCGPKCENNRTYRTCEDDLSQPGNAPKSCLEVRAPGEGFTVSTACTDGCYCPPGLLEDGPSCVTEGECGCFYNGSYIPLGETLTSPDCNGSVECTPGGVVVPKPVECGPHQNCSLEDNVVGCHCVDGYIRVEDECLPDPCEYLVCSPGAECVEGQCQCIEGYVGDCESCHDTDECTTGQNLCNAQRHEICVNTDGSYHCKCEEGYIRTDGVCQDVDECGLGVDHCPANSRCINEEGHYACSCCVGFVFKRGECVWEGESTQFVNTSAANLSCCDCNTPDCDEPGSVCGSDGVTYPTIRALIVQSCLNGEDVQPVYRGGCEGNCSQVQCMQPFATCEELPDGVATCVCPSCSDINIQIISQVCASNNIIYRSECEFEAAMCQNNIVDVVIIINDPTACNGNGVPGGPGVSSTNWTDCSVPCGFGEVERTVTVGNTSHTVTATCFANCENQTCQDFYCEGDRVCSVGSRGPQCVCPPCSDESTSPVCGAIGAGNVTTYRNLCELKKLACLRHEDYHALKEGACQREPVDCDVMEHYAVKRDEAGCANPTPHNYPTCKGGCGDLPDECCYKIATEVDVVRFLCEDGVERVEEREKITACGCIPPDELELLQAQANAEG